MRQTDVYVMPETGHEAEENSRWEPWLYIQWEGRSETRKSDSRFDGFKSFWEFQWVAGTICGCLVLDRGPEFVWYIWAGYTYEFWAGWFVF